MLNVIILAAGQGKRMQSDLPKVLHEVGGIPMLVRLISQIDKLNPDKIVVVVSKNYTQIIETLKEYDVLGKVGFAHQLIANGTGGAVQSALRNLTPKGFTLILNGDNPLIRSETLQHVVDTYRSSKKQLQIGAIELEDPTGSGRTILDADGNLVKIVEEKDCNEEERKIKTVNCGIYMADNDVLRQYVPMIDNKNAQNEFYLTDIVEIYKNKCGKPIGLYQLDKTQYNEIYNINTKQQLEYANSNLI